MSKLHTLTFWLLVIVIGLTPLDAIEVSEGSGVTYGRYAFIAMTVSAVLSRDIIPRKMPTISIVLLCFTIWATFTALWSVSSEITIGRCMLLVQYMIILIVMINVLDTPRRIRTCMIAWIIGACYIAYLTATTFSSHAVGSGLYRVDEFGNPNENSFMLNYALVFCYLIDKTKLRIPSLILTGYAVYAIVANGSRMGIILFLVIVVGFCIQLWQTKKKLYLAALIPGIMSFGGYMLSTIPQATLIRIIGITANIENGNLSNRENIWEYGFRMLKDHEIWNIVGCGWGTFGVAIKGYIGYSIGAHNFYLDLLVTTGFVGLAIVLVYFWKLFCYICLTYKATFINFLLLLIPLISMMSTNWQSRRWWFLMGAFIYLVYKSNNLTTNETKCQLR